MKLFKYTVVTERSDKIRKNNAHDVILKRMTIVNIKWMINN